MPDEERLGIYGIRTYEHRGETRNTWTQVGVAFRNSDDSLTLLPDSLIVRLIGGQEEVDQLVPDPGTERSEKNSGLLDVRIDRESEAEAELRVVLEERVGPRRTATLGVCGVRRRR